MKRRIRIFSTIAAVICLSTSLTVGANAKNEPMTTHIGIVQASSLRLRSGPSTDNATLDYAPKGDYVAITGKTGQWYKVNYNLTDGYMHENHIVIFDAKNVELGYGSITANKVNIRSGPSTSHTAIAVGNTGDKAYVIGFNRQWYKIIYGNFVGYIRSDYLRLTEIPYENADSVNTPKFFVNGQSTGVAPSASALGSNPSSTADKIIRTAKSYIGVPYLWGGSSPKGFDCSGFVQYVFAKHGISLPRTTDTQYKEGTYVSKSKLQPGDLVFLQNTYRDGISHVGIYVGDGKMIHASSSKGVVISDLSTSYYVQHYYGARRIL